MGDDNENLAHIALVTVIQFIACYLADWGVPKQFYPVLYCTMAGIVYMVISQIRKNGMCRMSLNSVKAFGIY